MFIQKWTSVSITSVGVAINLSWGGGPEEPTFEAEGRQRRRVLWEGQRAPSPPAKESGRGAL